MKRVHEPPGPREGSSTRVPAADFIEAYNRYQTLWAYLRLKGWNGERPELVPEIVEAEQKMRVAFTALHLAATGEPRPDYVERARRRIIEENQK